MPKAIDGKKLSRSEHGKWKAIRAHARRGGARNPEAVATAAIQKARKRRSQST